MAHLVVRARIIICLLTLLGVGSLAPQFSSAQSIELPVLSSVSVSSALPDSIVISGQGFSPGQPVFIALYDRWGVLEQETRWVTASESVYGPNGSLDPARGYQAGGNVREAFAIDFGTIYGPNGSQDPAQGYRRGLTAVEAGQFASCPNSLMVRAYDQQTDAWSNLIDVEDACGS